MRLPNADRALVPQEKITGYLLSFSHERGRPKARYFTGFGFSPDDWEVMASALVGLAMRVEVTDIRESLYGLQYVIIGNIESPDGRNPRVRSVWQVDYGLDYPRLVSAYRARD